MRVSAPLVLAMLGGATATPSQLPDVILAGYADWGQCDEALVQAAEDGLNVLIWFSINLAQNPETGEQEMTGPATGAEYFDCVADVAAQIEAKGLSVVHLVSIGGWNSPHPSTAFTGAEWWAFWDDWNTEVVARPERGWAGFAGFDWDIEGNDDLESPSNHFTVETLRLMGEMSVLAKAAGAIVAMAPAQSYLDPSTDEFSRSVSFPPHEPWQPDFFCEQQHSRSMCIHRWLVAWLGAGGGLAARIHVLQAWRPASLP